MSNSEVDCRKEYIGLVLVKRSLNRANKVDGSECSEHVIGSTRKEKEAKNYDGAGKIERLWEQMREDDITCCRWP